MAVTPAQERFAQVVHDLRKLEDEIERLHDALKDARDVLQADDGVMAVPLLSAPLAAAFRELVDKDAAPADLGERRAATG